VSVKQTVVLAALTLLAAAGCNDSRGHEAKPSQILTAPYQDLGRFLCAPQVHRLPCAHGVRPRTDYAYVLTTHCGVHDAYFDGQVWLTPRTLTSSPGNPPRWMDNPFQRGTMRLVSAQRAEFRARGHIVVFRPGPHRYRSERCE